MTSFAGILETSENQFQKLNDADQSISKAFVKFQNSQNETAGIELQSVSFIEIDVNNSTPDFNAGNGLLPSNDYIARIVASKIQKSKELSFSSYFIKSILFPFHSHW